MSLFHSCYLVMAIRGDVRASSLPTLVRALRPVFAAREISYWFDDLADNVRLNCLDPAEPGRSPLWRGETIEGGTLLTRYKHTDEEAFVASFEQGIAGREDSTFWMSMTGALRHRPPHTNTANWYGRWRMTEHALHEFVTIRITSQPGEPRELEFIFPLIGYPLTAARLANDMIVASEDPHAAQMNREELLPVIATAREAFGLAPHEVKWTLDGEFDTDYPDDARAIRGWLSRVNAV